MQLRTLCAGYYTRRIKGRGHHTVLLHCLMLRVHLMCMRYRPLSDVSPSLHRTQTQVDAALAAATHPHYAQITRMIRDWLPSCPHLKFVSSDWLPSDSHLGTTQQWRNP